MSNFWENLASFIDDVLDSGWLEVFFRLTSTAAFCYVIYLMRPGIAKILTWMVTP